MIDYGNAGTPATSRWSPEGKSLAEQAQHLAPGSHMVKALRQDCHLEATAIVIIRPLFGGYDPYPVYALVSRGRIGQPFASG